MIWFFRVKNRMKTIHKQTISSLENAISNNHFQINKRNSNLNKYDFLKHNLDEALIMQRDIQLKLHKRL